MEERQQRGLEIAARSRVSRRNGVWVVPSQGGRGVKYTVVPGEECSCPDYETRQVKCKHLWAVEYVMERETSADGVVTETETVKVTSVRRETYQQDWPAYNAAQTHEQDHFVRLLRDLCRNVQQPQQGPGRPRLPLSDIVAAMTLKTYSTMSGRRAMSEMREARNKGMIESLPDYSTTFRYMENADVTPVLRCLIEQSAAPLRSVEVDFAVDSSGFSTSVYDRWFDYKWGKERKEARWVKAHIICGVKTNIVTSAQVDAANTADAPQLPTLLDATAKTFDVREVSADKAYSSRKNLAAIEAAGATPYVPFRANITPLLGASGREIVPEDDSAWAKAYHFFAFNRETFLQHYHKRSNVETTFSMIKAKFGGSVRCRKPVAQVNEVLCKILCHNICVLIQSIYELDIAPALGLGQQKTAA